MVWGTSFCSIVPELLESEDFEAPISEGICLLVTMWVTVFEKNFSSR